MAKTLLDLTQSVLASMDSDEVDSIADTTESLQVATIAMDVFGSLAARMDLPRHYGLYNLTASGDSSKPTLMTLPSNVSSLENLRYNAILSGETNPNFKDVFFKPMDEFFRTMHSLNVDDDNVASFTYTTSNGSFTFKYWNDRAPSYYTTFDDRTLIFDAYDSEVDSTLQSAKTQAYGLLVQTLSITDEYEFPIDDNQYYLLLNEVKSMCFAELKQAQHRNAERDARRHQVSNQHKKQKVKNYSYKNNPTLGNNFGR